MYGPPTVPPWRTDSSASSLLIPGSATTSSATCWQAAELLERNRGCIHYVSTSDEPGAVWVSEVWTEQAAHDASLEPDDIRALIAKARPLIAGMSDQTELTVHGGKGLHG
jgi:quinol monooxygenase YgiN